MLRFPLVNCAATALATNAILRAMRDGCEKKAANPPSPRIGSPRPIFLNFMMPDAIDMFAKEVMPAFAR